MKINVKKVHPDAQLPEYATAGAGCFDLTACLSEPMTGTGTSPSVIVPTGLAFEIPEGHVMLLFSRSGHGFKKAVRLANCVGVIDSDYRGEVLVKLTRDAQGMIHVEPGEPIAQAMVVPVPRVELIEVEELTETERGEGGFGSTDEKPVKRGQLKAKGIVEGETYFVANNRTSPVPYSKCVCSPEHGEGNASQGLLQMWAEVGRVYDNAEDATEGASRRSGTPPSDFRKRGTLTC